MCPSLFVVFGGMVEVCIYVSVNQAVHGAFSSARVESCTEPAPLLVAHSCRLPGRVLTDRAFLAEPKTMLWAFMLGGAVAGAFIILFGLLGVFGAAQAITNPSRRALQTSG